MDLDLEEIAKDLFEIEEVQEKTSSKTIQQNNDKKEVNNENNKTSENITSSNLNLNSVFSHRVISNNSNIVTKPKEHQNIQNIQKDEQTIKIADSPKKYQKINNTQKNNEINNINNTNYGKNQDVKNNFNNILWTTKYSPKNTDEIIGNQSVVKKLMEWLTHWDDVVIRGIKREIDFSSTNSNYSNYSNNTKGRNKMENLNARACIISGPPGIGKTTTVRLIASKMNYRTFELNASDQRNKQIISSKVGYLMDNTTISKSVITEKNLIIMDEVDGMGGNEDKGGISALIEIIKKTKVPIICICNDIQNQKLRSMINHCYELKFAKPDKRNIIKRLHEICKIEGMNISPESLEYLCESSGNDIRQCLNFLEMRSRSEDRNGSNLDFKSKVNR
jgi:replication factor C subunit 1